MTRKFGYWTVPYDDTTFRTGLARSASDGLVAPSSVQVRITSPSAGFLWTIGQVVEISGTFTGIPTLHDIRNATTGLLYEAPTLGAGTFSLSHTVQASELGAASILAVFAAADGASNDQVSGTVVDTVAPIVTAFRVSSASPSHTVVVTTPAVATDAAGVADYRYSWTGTSSGTTGWVAASGGHGPLSFTVATDGIFQVSVEARDTSGNVSAPFAGGQVVIDTGTEPPVMVAFSVGEPVGYHVPITALEATDDVAVAYFILTVDDAVKPLGIDPRRLAVDATAFDLTSDGTHDVRVYPVDGALNVGDCLPATSVTVALTTAWHQVELVGGGMVTGIDAVDDGGATMLVCRVDVYGAYRLRIGTDAKWVGLVTATSMPADMVHVEGGGGVYEIRAAPTRAQRMYMVYRGVMLRSDDYGEHWVRAHTGLPAMNPDTTANANGSYRGNGYRIAIDPANYDHVYFGDDGDGLFETMDGGDQWSVVAAVAPGARLTGLAFNPSAGVTDNKTNGFFVSAWGAANYYTGNGGGTWTDLSGGPTDVHMGICYSGDWYVCGLSDADVSRYAGGTWTKPVTQDNGQLSGLLVDTPAASRRVITIRESGEIGVQVGGAAWTGWNWAVTNSAPESEWLAYAGGPDTYTSVVQAVWDPNVHGRIWICTGVGVAYYDIADDYGATNINWTFRTLGIENMVACWVIQTPNQPVQLMVEDRCAFAAYPSLFANPPTRPATHAPDVVGGDDGRIHYGFSGDYAKFGMTSMVAAIFNYHEGRSGYSLHGGRDGTWVEFASKPDGVDLGGGCMAVVNDQNIIWVKSNNGRPFFTKDRGQHWTRCTVPGEPPDSAGTSGYGWLNYVNNQIVTASDVVEGKVWLFNYISGFYESVDGGETFTSVHAQQLANPYQGFNQTLRAVPGHDGHLFFTVGPSTAASHPVNIPFFRTFDGCRNWTQMPHLREVRWFCFGPPKIAGHYPILYFEGWVDGVFGWWMSENPEADDPTYKQIAAWPCGLIDNVRCVGADSLAYGRVFVGYSGSSFVYGDMSDRVEPVVHTITVGWDAHAEGSTGTRYVYDGDSLTVTFTCQDGYIVSAVSIDDVVQDPSLTASYEHTFANVTGDHSIVVGTRVEHDVTPPSMVTGLVGHPVSSSIAALSWDLSSDNVAVAGYRVYYRKATDPDYALYDTVTDTAANCSALDPGTEYLFYVTAIDTATPTPNESAPCTPVSVTTLAAGAVGMVVNASPAVQTVNAVTATFAAVHVSAGLNLISVQYNGSTMTISGVTVDGVAATAVPGGSAGKLSVWSIDRVASGNVDVVVHANAYFGMVTIHVVGISNSSGAPTGVVAVHNTTGAPRVITGTVPTNGLAVVFGCTQAAAGRVNAWTSAIGDAETRDETGGTLAALVAHNITAGSQSPTLTVTPTNGAYWGADLVMISFGPVG